MCCSNNNNIVFEHLTCTRCSAKHCTSHPFIITKEVGITYDETEVWNGLVAYSRSQCLYVVEMKLLSGSLTPKPMS